MGKKGKSNWRLKKLFVNVVIKVEDPEKLIKPVSRITEEIKQEAKVDIALKIRINIEVEG